MNEWRMFVGLMFPDDTQEALRRQCDEWRQVSDLRGAKFAREFHITLKFLGNVPVTEVDAVRDALAKAYAGARTFALSGGRLGAFSSPVRTRVLWRGLREGNEPLTHCAARTESALVPLGFESNHDFRPHITLARFSTPLNLGQWILGEDARLADEGREPFPPFEASEFTLIHSQLTPQGALYTPVAAYPLN